MELLNLKDTTICLPHYMTSLSSNYLEEATLDIVEDVRIIACGVDPEDNTLYLITNDIQILYISPNGRTIPKFAVPINCGKEILIRFDEKSVYSIDTCHLLKESSSTLEKSKLFLNDSYLCDLENSETIAL